MAWDKSPPTLIEAFDKALPDDPRVDRRKMFGYPCAFVNGNMFTGLHQHDLIVRLDEPERAELMELAGSGPFEPFPGRAMREYVAVPRNMIENPKILAGWVSKGFSYGLSLVPKPPKKKRAQKGAKP